MTKDAAAFLFACETGINLTDVRCSPLHRYSIRPVRSSHVHAIASPILPVRATQSRSVSPGVRNPVLVPGALLALLHSGIRASAN
ncbi:hypothetical protein Trydic_g20142 [Trypoxylus dichotomus]